MSDDEVVAMVTSACKAAYFIAGRHKYGCGAYDVDDLIQDGCIALLQNRAAWYGCMDGLRKWLHRNRWWTECSIDEALSRAYTIDPIHEIIIEEQFQLAMQKMSRWSARKRAAWMLHYQDGKTGTQIAAILGITQGRVSQLLCSK